MTNVQSASSLELALWPLSNTADAVECLARSAGLLPTHGAHQRVQRISEFQLRKGGVEWVAEQYAVEAFPISAFYTSLRSFVQRCAPALLAIKTDAGVQLLAVLSSGSSGVVLLKPNGERIRVAVADVNQALSTEVEAPLLPNLSTLLESSGIPKKRRAKALKSLLNQRLAGTEVEVGWLLRSEKAGRPNAGLRRTVIESLSGLLGLYVLQYALFGWAWQCVVNGAFKGQLDSGWLAGWLLSLGTTIPLQALISWRAAQCTLEASSWLRVRMLTNILGQDPVRVRRIGTGQLLSRVLEAGALETQSLGGSLLALLSLVDLAVAGALLAAGTASTALLCSFACLVGLLAFGAYQYFQRRHAWTCSRLNLTHDLVERALGHRTRVVQEAPQNWHDGEDPLLLTYAENSKALDRLTAAYTSLPRIWLLTSFSCLTVVFLTGNPSRIELGIALAGIIVAARALTTLSSALGQISLALVSWRQIAPLVQSVAPTTEHAAGSGVVGADSSAASPRSAVLEARDLTICAASGERELLTRVNTQFQSGDAVLLQGPSGAGKSTLARVLAGMQPAAAGLLLSNGLDLHSLGTSAWRRRVSLAPQFHDNHVFSASLAFNVLLGRNWPMSVGDLAQAEQICRELGLGDLIDRMPSGMQQTVGETGWQLSHGERSRIFAARAIAADADLVILDESAGALDPQSALVVLNCAKQRSRSLLVIAHP